MRKHAFARILALVLVLTLLPCWGSVSAFAAPVNVSDSSGGTTSQTVSEATDLTMSGTGAASDVTADNGSDITLNIEGDVIASGSGNGIWGSYNTAYDGSSVEVNIGTGGNGDVSATNTADGGLANSVRASSEDGSSTTVIVTGDVTATATNPNKSEAIGVDARADITSEAEVKAENVTVSAEGGTATGVSVSAHEGSEAEVELSGNITVAKADDGIGINLLTASASESEVEVSGDVSVNADKNGTGVIISSDTYGESELTVDGPVTVTGEVYAQGVSIRGTNYGKTTAEFGDSITADSGAGNASGININVDFGGTAEVTVKGSVTSDGIGLYTDNGTKESLIDVEVNGDINAATTGIVIMDNEGETNFIVDGTVHGDTIGIKVMDGVTSEDLSITVWKIDTTTINGEEHVVANGPDSNLKVTDNTKEIEQNILYIIKVKPSQKDIITLSGGTDKEGRYVAKEGDKVAMKVNVPAGYKLTGAFGDKGEKLPLKMDSSGNYYVIVPRGGGVFLSALLASTDGRFSMGPKTDCVTVTFDLNGGHTITGNPGPIIKSVPVGTWIRLLEAPSKDGSVFERWFTEDKTVKVSAPLESFQVMGDITFISKWVGEEIAYQPTEEEACLAENLSAIETLPVEVEAPAEPEPESTAVESVEEPVTEEPVVEETANELNEAVEALNAAKEELGAVSEELKSAKEELKSTADELVSAKDELKATTEELKAAKDELRALLDELKAAAEDAAEAPEEEVLETPEDMIASEAQAEAADEMTDETLDTVEAAEEPVEGFEEPDDMSVEKASEEPDDMNVEEVLYQEAQEDMTDEPADMVAFEEVPEEESVEAPANMAVPEETSEEEFLEESADMSTSIELSPSISLDGLGLGGDDSGMQACLIINLGGGHTMELPVNLSFSLE